MKEEEGEKVSWMNEVKYKYIFSPAQMFDEKTASPGLRRLVEDELGARKFTWEPSSQAEVDGVVGTIDVKGKKYRVGSDDDILSEPYGGLYLLRPK